MYEFGGLYNATPAYPAMPQGVQMQYRAPMVPSGVMPQQAMTGGTNVQWVYVNGIDGARNQIVSPGCSCWMMDNNAPMIYYKTVSQAGQPALEAFRIEKVDLSAPQPQAPSAQIDTSSFATKAEMADLSARVEKLATEIGGLNV